MGWNSKRDWASHLVSAGKLIKKLADLISQQFAEELKAFEDIVETQDNSFKEDCLHLSVYVPKKAFEHKQKLPVLVYFHGGAYAIGKYSFLKPSASF